MWEYKPTPSPDELYHYGVLGMKWGKRKARPGAQEYKQSKKDLKKARKQYKKDIGTAARITGISYGSKGINREAKAYGKLRKAELDVLSAKAKYKSQNSKNSVKAEKKVYVREMGKNGLPGSTYDVGSRNRSKSLYDRIKADKGKKYADDIVKTLERKQTAQLIGSAVVAVGSAVAASIIADNM